MEWTSRPPIEGIDCLVCTNNGNHFAAHYEQDQWICNKSDMVIRGVTHWIVYPAFETYGPEDLEENLALYVPYEVIAAKAVHHNTRLNEELFRLRASQEKMEREHRRLICEKSNLQRIITSKKERYKKVLELMQESGKNHNKTILELTARCTSLENDVAAAEYQNSRLRTQLYLMEFENDFKESCEE